MVRAPEEFAAAAAPYVCVRVTDMRDVDLNLIRFDFDLTLAVVLMHADGTIYHRYGSRDASSPLAWMSIPSLVRLLRDTLADHRDHVRAPAPPPTRAPLRAIDLPALQQKTAGGQQVDCVHCHTINDAEHALAVQRGTFTPDDRWVHPDPARIGLRLDADDQAVVRAVAPGSPAARAGVEVDDRIETLGVQTRVRTIADVAWALHQAPPAAASLVLTYRRGDVVHEGELELPAGWKQCPPEDYAWRPYKWNLSPSCGFGGPALGRAEKQRLDLPAGSFAFRVQYIVDWGEKSHRGRAVARAGISKGDVVLAFAGKDDFVSVDHFHAWVALTRQAGEEVEVVLLRDGQRQTVRYALPQ